jgi:hypothetical protein
MRPPVRRQLPRKLPRKPVWQAFQSGHGFSENRLGNRLA